MTDAFFHGLTVEKSPAILRFMRRFKSIALVGFFAVALFSGLSQTLLQIADSTSVDGKRNERWLSARAIAKDMFAQDRFNSQHLGSDIRCLNKYLFIHFHEDRGAWDAYWLGQTNVSVFGAGAVIECDGKPLPQQNAKFTMPAAADNLGLGRQILEKWGNEISVERVLRLYDGSSAITLSGKLTNVRTNELSLNAIRLLEIKSPEGWWHLATTLEIPATTGTGTTNSLDTDKTTYQSTNVLILANARAKAALVVGFLSSKASGRIEAEFRKGDGGITLSVHQNAAGKKIKPGESVDFETIYVDAADDAGTALEKFKKAVALFAQPPIQRPVGRR